MHITTASHLLVTHKKVLAQFCPLCLWEDGAGETEGEADRHRERKWKYYLEFILARSFFAFFRAFCLSSPSFMPSEDTELSVTISTMYFFKERCSWSRQNQYIKKDIASNSLYYYLSQDSKIALCLLIWCQNKLTNPRWKVNKYYLSTAFENSFEALKLYWSISIFYNFVLLHDYISERKFVFFTPLH